MGFKSPPSHQSYFYPRPPRGGRLYPHGRCDPHDDISIHALREEGDRRERPIHCVVQ